MATAIFHPNSDQTSPAVLPLENGDRLTRPEFERRWDAMPEVKRAELIEGVVYMAAALRADRHGDPHALLMTLLGIYGAHTPGVKPSDNPSLRLDLDNEPQPDGILRILEEFGGRTSITADGYIQGGPELVAEVSASTTSIDLHAKLEVYRRHGVCEYLVWRVLDKEIDWFVLREGNFEPLPREAGEPYRSEIFLGLWLDDEALVAGEARRVIEVLQQGLDSPEHAKFVERLAAK